MSGSNCLNVSLFGGFNSPPLSLELRETLVDHFWQSPIRTKRLDFHAYFRYYQNACESQLPNEHAVETHRHLMEVVQHLKQENTKNREQIRTSLCATYPHFRVYTPARIDKSLDFAIRLWLGISVSGQGSFIPGQSSVHWLDNQTYTEAIKITFPTTTGFYYGQSSFSPTFTMYNVVRLGGFRIKWTCNLVDHLLLNKQGQLLVYHQGSVLEALTESDALPDGLAKEALRTLALLFPRADVQAHHWLRTTIAKAKDRGEHIDAEIGELKTTSLEVVRFSYWRHRLLALEEAFDKSEPATLSQWWHDRRRGREWATFWVAFLVLILTILFGLIQSITGIVQAWATVKALQLQIASTHP